MQIQILSVGKMKAGPERELYNRYADRFGQTGRQLGLSGISLAEIAESRLPDAPSRKIEEAKHLLAKACEGAAIILLDENGKDISSQGIADLLSQFQENGTRAVAFAIGGPDGHGDEMIKAASHRIRFGRVTWPHQIVRILLAEQLYRSNTIRLGHPYHRE